MNFEGTGIREPIAPQRGISLKLKKRPCGNWLQYMFYKILRIIFVSVWFYYIPLIVVIITNAVPTISHWQLKQECKEYVNMDCVGAPPNLDCQKLCEEVDLV